MKCLETRKRALGTWRRYRTDDGRVITTVELPEAVVRSIGAPKLRREVEAWQRGQARAARGVLVRQRIAEGVKPLAIADEFGMSPTQVWAIKRSMK